MAELNGNELKLNLVRHVDESYGVEFGTHIFPRIAQYVKEKVVASKFAVITDLNVRALYGKKLYDELRKADLDAQQFSFEAGEQHKTLQTCQLLINRMSKEKFGRDSCIIALGGGVVGDVAGFVASTFNRGVPYIQVPTTVLSQADSAVGGKTGVDTEFAKNVVGRVYQPKRVFVDVSTLETLTNDEFRNGLAETIKHGVIQDANFFRYLEENMNGIFARKEDYLLEIAKQNCRIKGTVVEIDPNEKGLRRILNYGHTVGHAIEKLSEYSLAHGKCVSIGMMVAGRIAESDYCFSASDLERQENLLKMAGLPTKLPKNMSNDSIIDLTAIDKKAAGGKARYCLPLKIGNMHAFENEYATLVNKEIVIEALDRSR